MEAHLHFEMMRPVDIFWEKRRNIPVYIFLDTDFMNGHQYIPKALKEIIYKDLSLVSVFLKWVNKNVMLNHAFYK